MHMTLDEAMTLGVMPEQGFPKIMHFTVEELKSTFPTFTNSELVELLSLAYQYFCNIGFNGGYTKLYYIEFQFIDITHMKATLYGGKHALFNSDKVECVVYKKFYDMMTAKHEILANE